MAGQNAGAPATSNSLIFLIVSQRSSHTAHKKSQRKCIHQTGCTFANSVQKARQNPRRRPVAADHRPCSEQGTKVNGCYYGQMTHNVAAGLESCC